MGCDYVEMREDRWLSAIFGHPVFKIEVPPVANDAIPLEWGERIRRHARRQSAAMYYAKVGTDQVEAVRRLASAGLYVVDVNVTFGLATRPPGPVERRALWNGVIDEISPDQQEDVLEIAATCFRYSRFHLDPAISPTIANRIKREWIRSYIAKERGEALFAASVDGRVVGFLAVLASEQGGQRIRTIDLIGVESSGQDRGVGRALIEFFINRYTPECDWLRVGTQVANVPSIRLYSRCGFSFVTSAYVMHMHVPKPETTGGT